MPQLRSGLSLFVDRKTAGGSARIWALPYIVGAEKRPVQSWETLFTSGKHVSHYGNTPSRAQRLGWSQCPRSESGWGSQGGAFLTYSQGAAVY